jgi:8-oxo-dGTP pyrophosphatase MutT (NUDIX family)
MIDRDLLIETLRAHVPADDAEREAQAAMLALCQRSTHPWSPRQRRAHITASALVLNAALDMTCLVHHGELGRWLQPGGHIEEDDATLVGAAAREVREETGLGTEPLCDAPLDLDAHEIPARAGRPAHLHLDCRFVLVATDSQITVRNAEALELRWFEWSNAYALADLGLRRMIRKLPEVAPVPFEAIDDRESR